MANVQFAGVTHRYEGTDRPAVDRLDLDIADGEFLVLVGPSGCGKSTSLRMLAGLESASDGRIEIGGTDVTHLAPRARDVAMVFQSYALYPNMTVEQNMGFALQNAGVGKTERRERVLEAARMLELEPLLGRKPAKLSGGQRQRVAWVEPSFAIPRCSAWTNHSVIWTPNCASAHGRRSPPYSVDSAPRRSTSPTIRSRR